MTSSRLTASQIVASAAWLSVIAAPWVAWLRGEPLRSPAVVGVIATAALVGLIAGAHHQGQIAVVKHDATALVAQELARSVAQHSAAEANITEARRLLALAQRHAREMERLAAEARGELPNVRGPFITRIEGDKGEKGQAGGGEEQAC